MVPSRMDSARLTEGTLTEHMGRGEALKQRLLCAQSVELTNIVGTCWHYPES